MVARLPLVVKRARSRPSSAGTGSRPSRSAAIRKARLQPGAAGKRLSQHPADLGRIVPQDIGKVTLPEVEDRVPVLVPYVASSRADYTRWKWVEQSQSVAAAIDQYLPRALIQLCRPGRVLPVALRQFGHQTAIVPGHNDFLSHSPCREPVTRLILPQLCIRGKSGGVQGCCTGRYFVV